MARVKRGTTAKAKHKKVFSKTKGYKHGRKNVFRQAKQAMLKAGEHSYRSKRLKKRRMKSLWIIRINAACKNAGIKYNALIKMLRDEKADINRKELARIAKEEPKKFDELVIKVKS